MDSWFYDIDKVLPWLGLGVCNAYTRILLAHVWLVHGRSAILQFSSMAMSASSGLYSLLSSSGDSRARQAWCRPGVLMVCPTFNTLASGSQDILQHPHAHCRIRIQDHFQPSTQATSDMSFASQYATLPTQSGRGLQEAACFCRILPQCLHPHVLLLHISCRSFAVVTCGCSYIDLRALLASQFPEANF